jgi:hypothetical protein
VAPGARESPHRATWCSPLAAGRAKSSAQRAGELTRPGHAAAREWLPSPHADHARARVVADRAGRTCGTLPLAARRSVSPAGPVAPGFPFSERFSDPGFGSGPVHVPRVWFSPVLSSATSSAVQSTVHVRPLPWGGRFGAKKEESSPRRRGGAPHSQVSFPYK